MWWLLDFGWLIALGGAGLIVWAMSRPVRRQLSPWAAAVSLGMKWEKDHLHGDFNGQQVRIFPEKRSVRVEIFGLPRSVSFEVDTLWDRDLNRQVLTGDPEFDRAINVSGRHEDALAMLNEEARKTAARILPGTNGSLKNGVLTATISVHRPSDTQELLARLSPLLSLASCITTHGRSVDERLLAIFLDDSVLEVQRKALTLLLRRDLPPWAQRARAAALQHPRLSIRLQATATLPAAEARAVIRQILSQNPSSTSALGEALKQLGQVGIAADAKIALEWLTTNSQTVQLAAAHCLARLGDLSAVEKLVQVKEATRSVALRDQIDGAIGAIQARHGKGTEGQLSVSALPKEGRLSVPASDSRGRLSITKQH